MENIETIQTEHGDIAMWKFGLAVVFTTALLLIGVLTWILKY